MEKEKETMLYASLNNDLLECMWQYITNLINKSNLELKDDMM